MPLEDLCSLHAAVEGALHEDALLELLLLLNLALLPFDDGARPPRVPWLLYERCPVDRLLKERPPVDLDPASDLGTCRPRTFPGLLLKPFFAPREFGKGLD